MSDTTPVKITGRIRYLRDLIAPGNEVVRVPVTAEMRANYCFPNVQAKIAKEGGEMVIGWTVWESRKGFVAEYHACWKKDGQLLDVTAKKDGEQEIVFFADPKATHVPHETSPDVFERLEPNRMLINGQSRLWKMENGRPVPM